MFKDELKDFAELHPIYDAYLNQRLASQPHIPPGEPFDQLVEYNGVVTGEIHRSVKSLYNRLTGVLHEAKRIWRAKHS